jgi:large subunit ribosomal protein L29
MQADEMREMTDSDARARIAELEEEQFRLRFRSATETLEDPLRIRSIRRDIARLNTVLRERELTAAKPPTAAKQPAAAKKPVTAKKPATAKKTSAKQPATAKR